MTLIVEDGSARSDAESYASVAQADDYHAKRGTTLWATLQTADKEAALRRATDYMSEAYSLRWKGMRATLNQALDWPRQGVERPDLPLCLYIDWKTVPDLVIRACCELAFRAAQGELAPDIDGPRLIAKTVGPIRKEYAAAGPEYKRYRQVDMLLKPLLAASGMGVRLERA